MDSTTLVQQVLTSFVFSILVIPILIRILNKHEIHELRGKRKVHDRNVPSLGGIGIFLGFLFAILFWWPQDLIAQHRLLIGALILMFVIGLRDDLLPLSPWQKLITQLIPMLVLLFTPNSVITSLYGLFGIEEMSPIIAYPLTLFTLIVIVNSINLIDGADGLAGSLGVTYCILLGIWFYWIGVSDMALVSWIFGGAIVAFLLFNWQPAKIFMGDTGALMIGLVTAFLIIQFLNQNAQLDPANDFRLNGVTTSLLVLFIPLFDTLRLFILRVSRRQSPFAADKNHVHHFLMSLGLTHSQLTMVLVAVTISLISLAIPLSQLSQPVSLALVLSLGVIYMVGLTLAFNRFGHTTLSTETPAVMKVTKGDSSQESKAS